MLTNKTGIHFIFIFLAITTFAQKAIENGKKEPDTFYGRIWILKPGQNYAAILAKLLPGDELVLHEGVYNGSALLNNSGSRDKPITIRGFGKGERRPVLLWEGTGAIQGYLNTPLFQVNGSNVVFDYLEFRSKYAYAMRIGVSGKGASNVTIKNSVFYECGGGCISANAIAHYDRIIISDNYFIGAKATPVYIGQHEGKATVTGFAFTGNVVDGSQIYGGSITGYGIELKLNVVNSVIENNYITNTKGPGIMVYGSEKSTPENANMVRNNIVVGSRNDAGIVVGGGPSTVVENLLIGCLAGIEITNYGNRNLLHNVIVESNTAACNRNYGVAFGNARDISAKNNVVFYTDSLLGRFVENPELGITNKSYSAPKKLDTLVQNKLMNIIPLRNNLKKIWLHVSSGPLGQSDIVEIIDLILEYKIPVQILNEPAIK